MLVKYFPIPSELILDVMLERESIKTMPSIAYAIPEAPAERGSGERIR